MGAWEIPGRFYKPALEHLKQQHKHFPKCLSSKTIVGENRDLLWKKEVDELKQTLIAEITRERLRRRQVRVSKDKTQQELQRRPLDIPRKREIAARATAA